jgi:mRNA interferase YafQ
LPPLLPVPARQFERDLKALAKRGKDLAKLEAVVATLCSRTPLERSHRDHPLKGAWVGYRECHVEPDWLLAYQVVGDKLYLARTGTHSDLFE